MPQPAASGHRLGHMLMQGAELPVIVMFEWTGDPALLAEEWESGLRRGAVLTLRVYECSYTLPALFVAVAADDVS